MKFVFTSLKELFTELHQEHLTNPPLGKYHFVGGPIQFAIKNFTGPCDECLYDDSCGAHRFYGCNCDDISYCGIKIVKYFHTPAPPEVLIEFNRRPKITPLSGNYGFRMSRTLPLPYGYESIEAERKVNRKSMHYLYNGLPKTNILLKLGLREWWCDKHNRFYPATTDVLDKFNMTIWNNEKYVGNTYVSFDNPYDNDMEGSYRVNDI